MTKTMKARTGSYTITIDEATTPDGRAGNRITCSCASHVGRGAAAIVAFAIADKNVHGTVLLANSPSPMMRKANALKGIWAA
jgi:hypothetical protein